MNDVMKEALRKRPVTQEEFDKLAGCVFAGHVMIKTIASLTGLDEAEVVKVARQIADESIKRAAETGKDPLDVLTEA